MTIPTLPSGLQLEDYENIEAAVMETARGRWFLLEYARRQRASETERLLQAIERLDRRISRNDKADAPPPPDNRLEDCNPRPHPSRPASPVPQDEETLHPIALLPPEPPPDPRLVALSRLDHLPLAEKLALFS